MSDPKSPVKKPDGPPEPYPCDRCGVMVDWAWVQQHDLTWMWEPASKYWSDVHEMIFCSALCSQDWHQEHDHDDD